MKKIGVALLGCGVVGQAVYRALAGQSASIAARCGAVFEVKKIAVRNPKKKRDGIPAHLFTKSIAEAVAAPGVDIVVELMGGEEAAHKALLAAIRGKKHVVTANKLLLAKRGEEIFAEAVKAGVDIGFEASVAGAVPVIRTLKEAVASGKVNSLFGIINGTSNYILTNMMEKGVRFADALEEAQALGYAEADPTFDVEGIDAAHKLTILASLAFGTPVSLRNVYVEGISRLAPDDFRFARQFGRVIKLLATARMDGGKLDVRVHPAMVNVNRPIARVDGVTNAVELDVSDAGRLMLIGPGAGGDATASAVVADLADIARDMLSNSVGRIGPQGFLPQKRKKLAFKPIGDVSGGYYLRFTVDDKPGVLARMAGILGANGISIDSVIQKGRSGDPVPLVILTHEAKEKNIQTAIRKINQLPSTRAKTMLIRLENGG
ncbi:MAG: homoserine dehydrogenase [Nitrospinae bacterium]|nr:homoserine dehydrogenase [Nitrospinota bacterium]